MTTAVLTNLGAGPVDRGSWAYRAKWWLSDAWVITLRNMRRVRSQPDLLVGITVQPIMFIVLFRYVFGGAIGQSVSGGDYAQFLMPGIFLQSVVFGSIFTTGTGIADDMKRGVIDRFRSLPMSRTSVLLGRTLADVGLNAISIVVMVIVGLAVGFRFEGSAAGAAAGIALMLFFAFSVSWFAAWLGLMVPSIEAVQTIGFMFIFPLTFASSAFAPAGTMPGWLQAFVNNNPITHAADSIRVWFNGGHAGTDGW
ncbi:MAG TPA: ABC transporter permease, partial [Mycobacteriales bacterium]|nr:ABC transporter permease [Mycobacteriales bacterium]